MSLFESTGALFVSPGGNVEHPEAWGEVIAWGALNIGAESQFDPNWGRQRQLMARANVTAFPWIHVRSMALLEALITKANAWEVPVVGVNVEDVVSDELSVAAIANRLKQWGGQAIIVTLPWLPNGQGWQALAEYPFALEYFPYDPAWNHLFDNVDVLVDHAFEEIGDNAKLSILYGTYPSDVAKPDGYNLTVAHSFYTADAIGTTTTDWNKWRYDGATPFITHGDNVMTKITWQDGNQAEYNWFVAFGKWQKAFVAWSRTDRQTSPPLPPAIPSRGPNYDPNDLTTWPWVDKVLRRNNILVEDHDKGEA